MVDMQTIWSGLVQLPFLAAFIWFSLRLMEGVRRDMKTRDDQWLTFLDSERLQRKDSMASGLAEVQKVAASTAELAHSVSTLAIEITTQTENSKERALELKRLCETHTEHLRKLVNAK
jgi:hypothetical protein